MINKKNLLGKKPEVLGDKDAIHVAIVSVRAGSLILPGQKCFLNKDREAMPTEKGIGVADPFRKENILRGQFFWLLLNQDVVPNVRHMWELEDVDFTPPTKEPSRNYTINEIAKELGCDYNRLIEVCSEVVEKNGRRNNVLVGEDGQLTVVARFEGDVEDLEIDACDLFSEWAGEVGHEFENNGSECCPEYDYPGINFAKVVKNE